MHLQDNPEEAEATLVKMIKENLRFDLQYTNQPNIKSFRIAIRKWAAQRHSLRAVSLLDQALLWSNFVEQLNPTEACFVDVMKAILDDPLKVDDCMERLKAYIRALPK